MDMNEVWVKLQKAKLHEDRRVKLANLQASRIVANLTIAFAACPQLVDHAFASEHGRLRSKLTWITIANFCRKISRHSPNPCFLALENMIGSKHEPGRSLTVKVDDLVQAKDYVAGFTDSRARGLYSELFRG